MEEERYYELKPQFINQKSFYGKAFVETLKQEWEEESIITGELTTQQEIFKNLYSYDSFVMSIHKHYKEYHVKEIEIIFNNGPNYYSKTTNRHKKEFFLQEELDNIINWDDVKDKHKVIILFGLNNIKIEIE